MKEWLVMLVFWLVVGLVAFALYQTYGSTAFWVIGVAVIGWMIWIDTRKKDID